VDGISHVINYDLPMVPEIYVHRIGRTGRAGATGIATSFCGREERGLLRDIERLIRRAISIEQEQPDYPREVTPVTPAGHRQASNGARPGRRNGGPRPSQGGPSKSRRPARPVQGAQASNGANGGRPAGNRRRRRPGGVRRRAL
jgi:ATP-dependent RNA helicase RhlE